MDYIGEEQDDVIPHGKRGFWNILPVKRIKGLPRNDSMSEHNLNQQLRVECEVYGY